MQGLNKAFLQNSVIFLGANPLRVRARQEDNSPFANLNIHAAPPLFPFDLRVGAPGVELIPFTAHAKTHALGTQRRISGLWLDYTPGLTRVIPLNNQAGYLFTPMLDGCYIGVGNNQICHVAGDVPGAGNTATMRGFAAAALGGAVVHGFDSNPADATQCTFVGIRGPAGWSFYVQGHDIFYNGHGALQPVFANGAHANQNVVPIVGLAYG